MILRKKSKLLRKLFCMMLAGVMVSSSGNVVTNFATQSNGIVYAAETEQTDSEKFNELVDELLKAYVTADPLSYNMYIQNPKEYNIDESAINYKFGEITTTLDGYKEDDAATVEIINALNSINYNRLTKDEQDLYDLIRFSYSKPGFNEKFAFYDQELSPYLGVLANLPNSLANYNFNSKQDFYNYLEIIKSVPDYFKSVLEHAKIQSEKGLFMSDRQLDENIEIAKSFIANKEDNFMITVFDHNIDKVRMSKSEAKKLKEANKDLVLNTMIPAYEDMIKGLEPLRGTGIGDYQGVCAYKNGKEYYEELVRQYSGSTMSIPQMKKEFEEQRQNLLNEAQKMFMENPDLLNQLMTEPLKIKVLSDPNEILEQLQEKASVLYPKLEGIEFGVKYVDPSLEPYSAPAFVYPISLDGNKEYTVNINKGSLGGADIWSTVAHEGYPGHLYQMLYVKQLGKHPLFNVLQSRGFLEAWAVNTEINSVAWEGYSDEFVKYNAINSLYTYYTLAILDINLNYEGWGKKAATKFLEKNGFGQAADFLIQNYLDAPAYNMAYSLGSLEFNKMRDKAKATLGDTYNETDFYKIYLECGSVNFDVVNKRLDQWLEKKVKEVKESEKVEETQKAEEVKETTK